MIPALFANDDQGRQAFTDLAAKAVQWIAGYYNSIESLPVKSQAKPGEIYDFFPARAPEVPLAEEEIFRVLNEVILPGITHWQHPQFYAFFPGNTSFPSIVGEMLTAGIAAQCMMWESSPAAAELEQKCLEWCRDLLGLPDAWQGVIHDTASTATLTALLTAREWKSGFTISSQGFDGRTYKVYASAQAHSSIEKAVRLTGIGTNNCELIECDDQLALIPALLEAAIQRDLDKGHIPVAVISTLGTTATGAIDPVGEIDAIAKRYGLWHHVDAAYAGSALMTSHLDHLRDQLADADSFVFNPHKWMFVQFDCTAYYVRDPELLKRTMSIYPSYLRTDNEGLVNDYRDWGIPLGRRFRALKLWMTLSLLGTDAIKDRLSHHIELAIEVENFIIHHPHLRLVYPRSLNIVTFSFQDDDEKTKKLSQMINESGRAYMTHAVVQGKGIIRWVTGQTYLKRQHIIDTCALIDSLIPEMK